MVDNNRVKCLKRLVETSATLFWVSCVPLIMLSCYLANNNEINIYQGFLSPNHDPRQFTAEILLGLGSAVIFIGFVGMLSISRQNRFLMTVYTLFLFAFIVAELLFCVFYAGIRDFNEDNLNYSLLTRIRKEYPIDSTPNLAEHPFKQTIDNIQFRIGHCCGVFGPDDWKLTDWYLEASANNFLVPRSCCKAAEFPEAIHRDNVGTADYTDCLTNMGYYTNGCLPKTLYWMQQNFGIVVGIAYCFVVNQIIGILSTTAFLIYVSNGDNDKLDA